jgi:ubiquinone/menaquinone biosynthesis C-methylase UbiE
MKEKLKIKKIYEESGENWSKFGRLTGPFLDLIKENSDKKSRVLDIGCGGGRLSLEINNFCKEVVGIDYSKSSLKSARKVNFRKNIKYVFMDGEKLTFPDESFDLVVSHAAINKKMCRAEYCFKEVFRVLKPNGKVIVKMVYATQGREFVKNLGYSAEEIREILGKNGFKKISTEVIRQNIDLDERTLNFFKRTELGSFIKEKDMERVKEGKLKKMDDSFMVVYAEKLR